MIPKPRSDNNMTAGHVEGWVPLVHGFHHGTHGGSPAGSGDPLVSEENAGQADLRKRPHVSERLSHSPGVAEIFELILQCLLFFCTQKLSWSRTSV